MMHGVSGVRHGAVSMQQMQVQSSQGMWKDQSGADAGHMLEGSRRRDTEG